MRKNGEYKNLALQTLTGRWGFAILVTFLFYIIEGFCRGIDYISGIYDETWIMLMYIMTLLFALPLYYGYTIIWLGMVCGEDVGYGNLFDGFKNFGRIFGTILLEYVYITLWSCLMIVPGIIKAYSYSMTVFILKDNPELGYNGAIEKSMRMMQGHKMQLFLLHLSFVGWFFLCLLTCGIGFILLAPYFNTAVAHFYEDLKKETE